MHEVSGISTRHAGSSRIMDSARGRSLSSPLLWLAHLALYAVATAALGAASFPTKPIRMIVATPIGSGPDVVARLIGTNLADAWGQQVVVDTRAGASGLIGAEIVAKATPDGYTLWMATMTQLISTTMYQRFLVASEFAPVSLVASTAYVIAVSASLPVKSIAELIAYAKARPAQVMYGSGGQGSTPHLCMELFQSMTGIKLVHVPYKGAVLALTDMMGGQMHATCAAAPVLPPFVQSGRVRPLVSRRGHGLCSLRICRRLRNLSPVMNLWDGTACSRRSAHPKRSLPKSTWASHRRSRTRRLRSV